MGGLLSLFDQDHKITVDRTLVMLILFLSYLLIRGALAGMPVIEITVLISLFVLYFFFKQHVVLARTVDFLFLCISLLSAVYGLLQYILVLPTNLEFRILGSYGNPSGLAANLAFTFPFLFVFMRNHKILSSLSALILLFTIVLTESRAGLLSVTGVSGIWFYGNFPVKFRPYKKYITGSIVLLAVLFCGYLFLLKQDSAIGRILIWKTSGNLIADHFLFGGGSYGFHKEYMVHQADYFVRHPESGYKQLAGNMMHTFNEYLMLTVKYGLFALLMVSCTLMLLIRKAQWSSPYLLSIISIGFFSLFSYPFQYPITWIVLIYSMAEIAKKDRPIGSISNKWGRPAIFSLICIACYFLIRDIRFEYKWNQVAECSLADQTREMLPQYETLHRSWNGNHLFLYNYAAELNHRGEIQKSLEILGGTINYWNDYDIQMLFSDNYRQSADWYSAEKHLKLAASMCPNRFIPLFYLHEVYVKTYRQDEARHIAEEIVKKKVKIPSSTVSFIQRQMRKYIENRG
jgi:O-antigen ligase